MENKKISMFKSRLVLKTNNKKSYSIDFSLFYISTPKLLGLVLPSHSMLLGLAPPPDPNVAGINNYRK
jgi:hypothetical protein